MIFDPWDDAQAIAQKLAQPHARLNVVVGAAWCQKCQVLRPQLEAETSQAPAHHIHLWLDLETHHEFLDGFVPDDLPLCLTYEQGHLRSVTVWTPEGQQPYPTPHEIPNLHARLCKVDWAA